MKPKQPAKKNFELPPDIVLQDAVWPDKTQGYILRFLDLEDMNIAETEGILRFYYTERFGWVLTTLRIGGKGRGSTERYYGITVKDKALVTVGKGPHVLNTLSVYLTPKNVKRLTPYIELWKQGMVKAGDTRDRISTRRAQTINRRKSFDSPWYS